MPVPAYYLNYQRWKQNPVTIILKASQIELEKLRISVDPNETRSFIDSGVRLGENILTGVGFFPSDRLSDLFADYKLV
jgi:glycine/serine hydroxymethyltransferase